MRKLPRVFLILKSLVIFASFCSACYAATIEATLLAPQKGGQVSGPKVEVAVGYNSGSSAAVSRMDLLIDGVQRASKVLETPRNRGVASFLWDSRQVANGKHKVQVDIYSGPKLLTSVTGAFASSNAAGDYNPAITKIENIKNGSVISGSKEVKVSVSGVGPGAVVTVLIDKSVTSAKNQAPYSFSIDTTDLTDGRHILEAYALDDTGNRIDAQPVEISVRNKVTVATAAAPKPTASAGAAEPKASSPAPKTTITTPPKPGAVVAKNPPAQPNKTAAPKPSVTVIAKAPEGATTPKTSKSPEKTSPAAAAKASEPAKATSPKTTPTVAADPVVAVKQPASSEKTPVAVKPPVVVPAKESKADASKVVNKTVGTPKPAANQTAKSPSGKPGKAVVDVAVVPSKTAKPEPFKPNASAQPAKPMETPKNPVVAVKPVPAPAKTSGKTAAAQPTKVAVAPAPKVASTPTKTAVPVAPAMATTAAKAVVPAKTPAPKAVAKATTPTHTSAPPVKMAWVPSASEKVSGTTSVPATLAKPKPESQESEPVAKVKPTPAKIAIASAPEASSTPSLKKPTATAPEPLPKPRPVTVAKAATPAPTLKATTPAARASATKVAVVPKPQPTTPEKVDTVADATAQHRGKVMEVSLRWALQMAGLRVSFADDGRVIRGFDGAKSMEFQVGAKEVLVDDHVVVLPSPVTSVGGRAMIPLSFLVEQLGLVLKDPSLMSPQVKAGL